MASVSELYAFMEAADSTLARKVLGEGEGEEAEAAGAAVPTTPLGEP